jgi:dTDP-4-dehydrorhamnose 3,5-epimerase
MPFKFAPMEIPEVILIEPRLFPDERGFFMETYKKTDYEKAGINHVFVQENQSLSTKDTLRGLHYQKNPNAQGKLIRSLKGEIYDVAVDIRIESPTYGKYVSAILSDENKHLIYIPAGFAHGFCVLSKEAEVCYLTTGIYSPEHERGIIWNDPDLGIDWPIKEPVLSEKDLKNPTLKKADNNFQFRP